MSEPQDVLIQASPQDLAHKWADKVPDGNVCYWTVNGTPRRTEPGRRVYFASTSIEDIYAWAEIVELEDGKIWFEPVQETHLPCLDDAPTRGFRYIDPLLPRLQETDWGEKPTGEIVVNDQVGGQDG